MAHLPCLVSLSPFVVLTQGVERGWAQPLRRPAHHVLGKEVLLHRRHHGGSPRMVCAAMRVSWVSSDRFVPHLPSGGWSPPVRPSCVLLDAVPLGLLSCPSSPPQCASQAHHGVEWGQVSSHLLDLRRVSLRAGEPACRALSLPPRHRWQVLGGVRYTLRSLLCGHVCGLREEVVLGFAPLGVLRALSPWPSSPERSSRRRSMPCDR